MTAVLDTPTVPPVDHGALCEMAAQAAALCEYVAAQHRGEDPDDALWLWQQEHDRVLAACLAGRADPRRIVVGAPA